MMEASGIMVDSVVFAFIGLAAVFGLIRGVISQVMSLVGLGAAFFFAPALGRFGGGFVQDQLGCSLFMAEKFAMLLFGVGIYVLARLIGLGVEKLVVNRVRPFRKLNRLGGAALGALKGTILVALVFIFLTLIPRGTVQSWFPRVTESRTYQMAARYNPVGKQGFLERARKLRAIVSNPEQKAKLKGNRKIEKLLDQYGLKGAFSDPRLLEKLEAGDYERISQLKEMEKLMKDDQLESLLDQLSKQPES